MSLTEAELRLREQRLARREQVLRAREAELSAEECPADSLEALARELDDLVSQRPLLSPAPGVVPGLLGVWLLASPVVLGLGEGSAAWSCIACGLVVVIAAGIRLSGAAHPLISCTLVAAGVWLIAAALWLDALPRATTDCAVSGALVMAAGFVPLAMPWWCSGFRGSRSPSRWPC